MWVAATPPHHTNYTRTTNASVSESKTFSSRIHHHQSLSLSIPIANPQPLPLRLRHCSSPCLASPCLPALFLQLQHTLFCQITQLLAMAGVAQSMIACSTSTSTGSWRTRALFTKPAGKSAQTRAPLRICAVKAPEDCNDEECAPVKEVSELLVVHLE